MHNASLLKGYENTRLVHYNDMREFEHRMVDYKNLPEYDSPGVLKYDGRDNNGNLVQLYTEHGSHVGVIAATRMGKSTSITIPYIRSFARQKRKKSMVISDPKGEVYRKTANALRAEGYTVLLLNLRDALHSEYWNPLTIIRRKYLDAFKVYDEVKIVKEGRKTVYKLRGQIYKNQTALDDTIERIIAIALDDVSNDIENLCRMAICVESQKDPYWENSARLVLQAFIWAMLEDSRKETKNPSKRKDWPLITEETFTFSTIFTILASFRSHRTNLEDGGYFTDRKPSSRAYVLAKDNFLDQATSTRQNILCVFNTKMSPFRESTVRLITSANSFDFSSLIEKPTAVFIDYKDEVQAHYHVISLFVQDCYRYLIDYATEQPSGALDIPFYFMLDEFGNFPKIENFKTVISAAAGRKVFFVLIMQSFAQLNEVYGHDTAEIIRDNLNVQIMLGTNNPSTLEEFSKCCGEYTRLSPLSALNGSGVDIDQYQTETIRRIPKSMLAHFEPGECVITEANSGYVMWSKLERYYLCPEFTDVEMDDEKKYQSPLNPFDEKYTYVISKNDDDDDDDDLF